MAFVSPCAKLLYGEDRKQAKAGMSTMGGGNTPDDRAMRDRLDQLKRDLDARGAKTPAGAAEGGAPGPGSLGSAMSLGFRVMSELVAAVVVGALIGWQMDRWLGTSPLLLILFLALGAAAGFWTVYRTATRPTGLPGGR